MGVVKGICISEQRGTAKKPISKAVFLEDWGIEKDAHAGKWHRQISLLSFEKIIEFQEKGAKIEPGDFGENLIIEGFDLAKLPVGTILRIGEVVLEITQIGKECHSHCKIFETIGDCIMPREGIFAKVVKGGTVSIGDSVVEEVKDQILTAVVITMSDRTSLGTRIDESGSCICALLTAKNYHILETIVLPDDELKLQSQLIRCADELNVDLILTTGGTGFSQRDITPEATMAVATRTAPGIAEAMRYGSLSITKRAMLSRGVSVIRNQTLIVNLPGSPKAVKESLAFILDELEHGIHILKGTSKECAR